MKREILLILLVISLVGIGCSLSIDIGKQEQLDDQVITSDLNNGEV